MISLFFHLILIFCLHCQSFLRISGFTKICNKKITFQCKIFIVPEEGWFGQPKYSTHIKTFLRCTGFCLYFLPRPLACVASVSVRFGTNFDVLAARKLGREQKRKRERGRGEKVLFSSPPPPLSFLFSPQFSRGQNIEICAETPTETLATQAT